MSVVEFELPLPGARARRRAPGLAVAPGFVATCQPIRYDTPLEPLLRGLSGNPFQSTPVLSNWFATFSGRGSARECFLVALQDEAGRTVFALPVTRRRVAGLVRIELPHSGVIDFTTPFRLDGESVALPAPQALWALIKAALPPADLVIFRRMEKGPPGAENPLYLLPQAQASRFVTWRVSPLAAHGERHAALAKPYRKKLRRNREKFLDLPGARIEIARTPARALALLERLEAMQGSRIRAKGLAYGLDCQRVKAFYRRLVDEGIENGQTLMLGLMLGEEMVSAGFAILAGEEAVYLRVASDFGPHAALTPGLIVTDAAMDEAHARGIRHFDFGMGDYHFKRQLGGRANPLKDLIVPLSTAGALAAFVLRTRQAASVNPLIRKLCRRKPLPAAGT